MFTNSQKSFIELAEATFGKNYTISRNEINDFYQENKSKITFPHWLTKEPFKVKHGVFKIPTLENEIMENVVPMKKHIDKEIESLIPEKDSNFEKFGFYSDLKSIMKSNKFFPVFISGHSGIGKTFLVEQVCAELKRECIRINFSVETDETAIIGGPTLVNGNITHTEGPLIKCLRNGWVCLMDEIDRAAQSNLLIINGILEGKGYHNPRTGEYIKAKEGFNVIATANTKGSGDESGKYLAQIMDTAFLERFFVTFEQPFPTERVENKILSHHLDDIDFIDKLCKWAQVIRKTYDNGGIDEIISTRRLVHIAETYNIFKNKIKSIDLCCSRYETHIKESFIDLYQKIDSGIEIDENGEFVESATETHEDFNLNV
jgi:midasin (ATPase involved in ribosome maturation)